MTVLDFSRRAPSARLFAERKWCQCGEEMSVATVSATPQLAVVTWRCACGQTKTTAHRKPTNG